MQRFVSVHCIAFCIEMAMKAAGFAVVVFVGLVGFCLRITSEKMTAKE